MSSWFSLDKITAATGDLTSRAREAASAVQSQAQAAASQAQAAASQAQAAASRRLGVDENELLKKLTLRTPELVSERARIDEEERRKEEARDTLAELLPWETRDEEREVLVEECREAVLALSGREETFRTPYGLPGSGAAEIVAKQKETEGEGGDADGEDAGSEPGEKSDGPALGDKDDGAKAKKSPDEMAADAAVKAAEVQAKVAKLSPLPPLLDDFDLDTHVGLIQRVLKEDAKLVAMHSNLSGPGEREIKFWKNYFFHCAYVRYEAGLSIDEIWATLPPPASGQATPAISEPGEEASSASQQEEIVTFEPSSTPIGERSVDGAPVAPSSPKMPGATAAPSVPSVPASSSPGTQASSVTAADYEVVTGSGVMTEGDDELDDLEAEIARELEGLVD